jgi:hypothetical protein
MVGIRLHSLPQASNPAREVTMEKQQPQIFSGITPEQFEKLTAKAQAAGIGLTGSSGTSSKFGVEIGWSYSAATRQLTVQCLNTPFFVKPEDVCAKIDALVKETCA